MNEPSPAPHATPPQHPAAAPGPTPEAMASEEMIGKWIGSYRLLQLIGEGGFGSVYLAEQREPVRREVALKLIKPGMDTRQVIARFEAERQALAVMDHPNIARVYEAGATEAQRPYFVMELVRGEPITTYCDKNNLPTRQRLELFAHVCSAVQHAHTKGIIHRDLKPSNVLVTLHDSVPVPKVIDFGIAKATSAPLTDRTLYTEFRQLIGTPEYMSPEQAEMSGLDIDTRTDIYSLGVLLYELLTGTTPFDAAQLRSAAINEIQRIIREEEPPRPSTRLNSLLATPPSPQRRRGDSAVTGHSLEEIARRRRTDPHHLARQLRGDLDWIVMRALEKDRTRRYDSAAAFAQDIGRHLRDEPVEAGPPSAFYRVRKFARRHRGSVIAAGAVAAALLVGLTGTSMALIWALRERERADANAKLAEQNAAEAHQRFEVANAVNTFFNQDMLLAAMPTTRPGQVRELRLGDAFDGATLLLQRRVEDGEYASKPEIEAAIRKTLGDAFMGVQDYERAREQYQRALELRRQIGPEDHPVAVLAAEGLAAAQEKLRSRAE